MSIPVWARQNFAAPTVNPLNMYASSRLMAFGAYGASGRILYPWKKNKVAHGANKIAQGNMMLYSPAGSGTNQ